MSNQEYYTELKKIEEKITKDLEGLGLSFTEYSVVYALKDYVRARFELLERKVREF